MHARAPTWILAGALLLLASRDTCGAATPAVTPSPPAPDRPNIVLIVGDDHGWPYYGFMGSDVVKTPRLDRLAASGTVFPYAYNTASRCLPSLRSMLTGLYPHQFQLRAGQIRRLLRANGRSVDHPIRFMATLPRLLQQAGYATFQAGKLWDGVYGNSGFGAGMTATEDEAATRFTGNRAGLELGRKGLTPVFSFVERNRDRPFFLWFAPQLPHRPHDAPDRLRAPYPEDQFSPTAREYYANCTWEDEVIGQLLDHLDRQQLRQNTLIVYVSDNGWEQTPRARVAHRSGGGHGKGSVHELGLRTPLIFAWPDHIPAGRRIEEFVSTVDLLPTLLSVAGVAVPEQRTGIDLMPAMTSGARVGRTQIVGGQFVDPDSRRDPPYREFRGDAYFVRDRDWYYVLWGGQLNQEMLFDKSADPEERENVAHLHPKRAAAYRDAVSDWLDSIGVGRRRVGWVPAALKFDRRRFSAGNEETAPTASPRTSPAPARD